MPATKKWFIEATGHTNEVIATELGAENAHKDVLCQDGKVRDLWACDYSLIPKLLKNEASGQLEFKVFFREGMYGPIKPWPFLRRKRMGLAEAVEKKVVKKGRGMRAANAV